MKQRTWIIPPDTDQARDMCAHAVYKTILASPAGYAVRIGPVDKSSAQRGLFHSLCGNIGNSLGYTGGEIKQMVKQYHYGLDEKKVGDKWYRILRSSEEDDKEQYTALIDAAYRWGAENGVDI